MPIHDSNPTNDYFPSTEMFVLHLCDSSEAMILSLKVSQWIMFLIAYNFVFGLLFCFGTIYDQKVCYNLAFFLQSPLNNLS